jgi:hypothetical protein
VGLSEGGEDLGGLKAAPWSVAIPAP